MFHKKIKKQIEDIHYNLDMRIGYLEDKVKRTEEQIIALEKYLNVAIVTNRETPPRHNRYTVEKLKEE